MNRIHAGVLAFISKPHPGTVRITAAHMEVKGVVFMPIQKHTHVVLHVGGAAHIHLRFKIERINARGFDVLLADAGGGKSTGFEDFRYRLNEFVGAEPVNPMTMPILTMRVTVQPRENASATDRTRRTGAEGIVEDHTAPRKRPQL